MFFLINKSFGILQVQTSIGLHQIMIGECTCKFNGNKDLAPLLLRSRLPRSIRDCILGEPKPLNC